MKLTSEMIKKIVPVNNLLPPKRYMKRFLHECEIARKITENLKRGVR